MRPQHDSPASETKEEEEDGPLEDDLDGSDSDGPGAEASEGVWAEDSAQDFAELWARPMQADMTYMANWQSLAFPNGLVFRVKILRLLFCHPTEGQCF